jgi:hypothetical protein
VPASVTESRIGKCVFLEMAPSAGARLRENLAHKNSDAANSDSVEVGSTPANAPNASGSALVPKCVARYEERLRCESEEVKTARPATIYSVLSGESR